MTLTELMERTEPMESREPTERREPMERRTPEEKLGKRSGTEPWTEPQTGLRTEPGTERGRGLECRQILGSRTSQRRKERNRLLPWEGTRCW